MLTYAPWMSKFNNFNSWIDFQNPDTRFCDPGLCAAKGMTLMSWLRLNQSSLRKTTSSYISSSGGQSTKGRGFAVLHFSNKYIVILSTKNKQWKLDTPVLATGWFNFAFTWRENGQLKLYVYGTRVASGKPSSSLQTTRFVLVSW